MEFLNILFGFQGRIGRGAYWLGSILQWVVLFIANRLLHGAVPDNFRSLSPEAQAALVPGMGGAFLICVPLLIICIWWGLALGVKRWHDRGKSGVWVLINFIPIVGPLWQFIECGFLPGTIGRNTYGGPTAVADTASVFS